MVPYIITLIITNIILYFGEKKLKNNKILGIIILIIGIMPITLLAGIRTTNLGWDVQKYGVQIFGRVSNMNRLIDVKNYISIRGTEAGFVYLIYFLSKISNNINFVLFGLNAIVSYSVLYYAYNNREKCSITFTFILYETLLYSISYSTLRQSISLALTFIAYTKYKHKKIIQTILILLFSTFFHDSAKFALLFLLIFINNDSNIINEKYKKLINIIIVFSVILIIMSYDSIMQYLWQVGILKEKYFLYLSNKFNSETLHIRWPYFLIKLFSLLLGTLYFKTKNISNEDKKENKKWMMMLIIDLIITLLSFKILTAHRLTYYIFFPAIFSFIPQTIRIFKDDKHNKILGYSLITVVYVLYYLISLPYYSIYPYRSIFK